MDAPVISASEASPTQSNRSETSTFSFYLVYSALGMVLYALSPGPVAKCLGARNRPYPQALFTAYAPLQFCCDRFPPRRALLRVVH
jgi:hypothetical protein